MASQSIDQVSPVETIKSASRLLRGSLQDGLADPLTGSIAEDDTQLSKFHGIYQQDDRDLRAERQKQKLEPAYSFMIRARVPGGTITASQWLTFDALARNYANDTLRITTRQAIQLHGVLKRDLKKTIAGINDSLLDTFAACGDVNRNVMCTPVTDSTNVYATAQHRARCISDHLTPHTNAYHEIWLDGKKQAGPESEPIYGRTYLPRKFKISIAIPPTNDTDVFAQDLGFIAVQENDELLGFNVCVGGGMGVTHGDPDTYPRTADVIGFCEPSEVVAIAEAVVTTQRDYGDRSNRKHARLKYTIDDRGLGWFVDEVERRSGLSLQPAREVTFDHNGDRFGWWEDDSGRFHLGLFVPGGRIMDSTSDMPTTARWLEGLATLARQSHGEFRLTPNQNLIVADIKPEHRDAVASTVAQFGLDGSGALTPTRLNALACVALPTCGLAMAEAERYLPALLGAIEQRLAKHGLEEESISLRITGCPNGCARPYLADIGLVGRAPGRYVLRLGGGDTGRRLNQVYLENADESTILSVLDELFGRFVDERTDQESFGAFARRCVLKEASR